jgi:hypothetical protein
MHWYFVTPFSVPGSLVWTLPSSCNKTGILFLLHWRLWEVSLGVITVNSSSHNTWVMQSWTFVTDSSSSDVFKLHTDKRNKFHGREFFLSAPYSLRWTRNSPNVIESEVSLSLHKNSPLIPSQSSQIQSTPYLFNIIIPSIPRSPEKCLPFLLSNKNFVRTRIPYFSHLQYSSCQSPLPWFNYTDNILWKVRIIKYLFT